MPASSAAAACFGRGHLRGDVHARFRASPRRSRERFDACRHSNPPGFGAGLPYPARKMRMPSAARPRAVASTSSRSGAARSGDDRRGCAAISGNTMGNRSFISVWSAARCGFVGFRAGAPVGPRRLRNVVACAASPAVCARLPLTRSPSQKGGCGRCGGPVRMAAAGVEDLLEQHLVFVSVGRREPVPSDARLREARIAEEREGWPGSWRPRRTTADAVRACGGRSRRPRPPRRRYSRGPASDGRGWDAERPRGGAGVRSRRGRGRRRRCRRAAPTIGRSWRVW